MLRARHSGSSTWLEYGKWVSTAQSVVPTNVLTITGVGLNGARDGDSEDGRENGLGEHGEEGELNEVVADEVV